MTDQTHTIWVTMNTKTRRELRFKVKVTDGKFTWPKKSNSDYLVRADAAKMYKGKPSLEYNEGNAEPINPFGREVHVTAEELNEIGRNNYLRNSVQAFKQAALMNMQWVMIGVLALAVVMQFWFGTQAQDELEALRNHLNLVHPPPPQPTTGAK